MLAAASYPRRPGDPEFRAFKIDVRCADGRLIREVTTFGATVFPALGLRPVIRWRGIPETAEEISHELAAAG